jgi:hypothetical protein
MKTTMCSEKSFNDVVHPIYKKRVGVLPYSPTNKFLSNSYWNQTQNIFLDMLAHRILLKEYNYKTPKDSYDPKVIEKSQLMTKDILDVLNGVANSKDELKEKWKSIDKPSIVISDNSIRDNYKFLGCLEWTNQYENLAESVSKSIFRYKAQIKLFHPDHPDGPRYLYHNYVIPSVFGSWCNLFNINIVDDNPLNRKIEYKFNTPYGIIFYHNIVSLHLFWYPKILTELSDNAYWLYKRYFFKKESKGISFDDVKKYLGYNNRDEANNKKKITTALEELKYVELITYENHRSKYDNKTIEYNFFKK